MLFRRASAASAWRAPRPLDATTIARESRRAAFVNIRRQVGAYRAWGAPKAPAKPLGSSFQHNHSRESAKTQSWTACCAQAHKSLSGMQDSRPKRIRAQPRALNKGKLRSAPQLLSTSSGAFHHASVISRSVFCAQAAFKKPATYHPNGSAAMYYVDVQPFAAFFDTVGPRKTSSVRRRSAEPENTGFSALDRCGHGASEWDWRRAQRCWRRS